MAGEVIPPGDYDRVVELCKDAEDAAKMGRITPWEGDFIDDLRVDLELFNKKLRLTDKQWAVIERIEKKVYAV